MRQSSTSHAAPAASSSHAVIVQRGTELDDIVRLLGELGIATQVHSGSNAPTPNELAEAAVVIASGTCLADGNTPNLSLWPRTLAVVDGASKTLLAHLSRIGVRMIVRRPIHPATLKLLLLHEAYRGPERRRQRRISIGHPIRVAGRILSQGGTLLELSDSGARLEVPGEPKVGSALKLLIGKDVTGERPLKLQVKVVRCIHVSGKGGRKTSEIGVAFVGHERSRKTIAKLLDRFARGPASWTGRLEVGRDETASRAASSGEPMLDETTERPDSETASSPPDGAGAEPTSMDPSPSRPAVDDGLPPHRPLPPSRGRPAPEVRDIAISAGTTRQPPALQPRKPVDRRQAERVTYDKHIVALGNAAARVLVGRDLSTGGMRIEQNELIQVGDTLRLALHGGAGVDPVVVLATATRSEGQAGTVLEFEPMTNNQRSQLEQIVASSCAIEGPLDGEDEADCGPIVMSEMLENVTRDGGKLGVDAG